MPEKVSFWITEGDASKARLMYPAKPALNIVYGRYNVAAGEYAKLCGTSEPSVRTIAANGGKACGSAHGGRLRGGAANLSAWATRVHEAGGTLLLL